jgi:hypothetical protein
VVRAKYWLIRKGNGHTLPKLAVWVSLNESLEVAGRLPYTYFTKQVIGFRDHRNICDIVIGQIADYLEWDYHELQYFNDSELT